MSDRMRMLEAGHAWMRGELSSEGYFALVRKSAGGAGWCARVRGWWEARR